MIGTRLLRISALYLLLGACMGLFMGIAKDFTLSSVHAHVTLMGWAALAFAGLVYIVLPACAASGLATVHFWSHNIGLPVMMLSLALHTYGIKEAEKLIAISSSLVLVSLLALVINIFLNGKMQVSVAPLPASPEAAPPVLAPIATQGLR